MVHFQFYFIHFYSISILHGFLSLGFCYTIICLYFYYFLLGFGFWVSYKSTPSCGCCLVLVSSLITPILLVSYKSISFSLLWILSCFGFSSLLTPILPGYYLFLYFYFCSLFWLLITHCNIGFNETLSSIYDLSLIHI